MKSQPIDANFVIETDGAHYPVRLYCIPCPGDVINFQSHRNMFAKQQPYFSRFKVLRVEHEVQDFVEDHDKLIGSHIVNVIVKDLGLS